MEERKIQPTVQEMKNLNGDRLLLLAERSSAEKLKMNHSSKRDNERRSDPQKHTQQELQYQSQDQQPNSCTVTQRDLQEKSLENSSIPLSLTQETAPSCHNGSNPAVQQQTCQSTQYQYQSSYPLSLQDCLTSRHPYQPKLQMENKPNLASEVQRLNLPHYSELESITIQEQQHDNKESKAGKS